MSGSMSFFFCVCVVVFSLGRSCYQLSFFFMSGFCELCVCGSEGGVCSELSVCVSATLMSFISVCLSGFYTMRLSFGY